jgi:RNA polymerase sigma-70 factor (ECF subfamily)
MARYARDEVPAFEVLLSRYRKPLFGFLRRFLGRPDQAEDVFQEVFYEVIRARERFRIDSTFSSWIFRIARNRAVDRLRRNGLRNMESLDAPLDPHAEAGESKLDSVPGSNPSPEEATDRLEMQVALESALAALPAEQREVFWLKEKSGLTLAEVAKLSGVSENTVKSRLRYALEKIRADLAQKGFQP